MAGAHSEDGTDEETDGHRRLNTCISNNSSEGDILTDAPKSQSWNELRIWTQDRKKLRIRASTLSVVGIENYGVPSGTIRTGIRI